MPRHHLGAVRGVLAAFGTLTSSTCLPILCLTASEVMNAFDRPVKTESMFADHRFCFFIDGAGQVQRDIPDV